MPNLQSGVLLWKCFKCDFYGPSNAFVRAHEKEKHFSINVGMIEYSGRALVLYFNDAHNLEINDNFGGEVYVPYDMLDSLIKAIKTIMPRD